MFNGTFYIQTSWLPKGSPISGLYDKIFNDILHLFVDWQHQNNILYSINLLNPNFLDLFISHATPRFSFNIFRKPTYTDTIMPHESSHPYNKKMSAFHCMINNTYPYKISNPEKPSPRTTAMVKKYNLPKKANSKLISQKLHKSPLDINPALYTYNAPSKQLYNNKLDRPAKLENCGIYKVTSEDCHWTYKGKTRRSFSVQLSEHIKSSKNNHTLSNTADHIHQINHKVSPYHLSIQHIERKGRRLDLLATYEFNKAQKQSTHLINDQLNLCSSPILNII